MSSEARHVEVEETSLMNQHPDVQSVADDASASLATRARSRAHGWTYYAEAYALLLLTVLLALFFTFLPATSEVFPSTGNFQVTAAAQAVVVIIAVASLVPLVCGEFDLSVGANAGMTSIFCASAMVSGWSPAAALVLAIAIGGVVGLVNGLLITKARVNSFVTTLGTAAILAGIVQWKSGGEAIFAGIPAVVTDLGTNKILGIPNSVYLALAVAAAAYYVLRATPFGRYLYAIGSNRNAAELVGLRVDRLVLLTFVVSGLVCGLAGALQIAVSGTGNPRVGESFTLPALAAAFLSVAAIKPGRYNVWGAVVAITFLAVLNSGLNLAGVSNYVTNFANGLALILGVAMSSWLGRRRALA